MKALHALADNIASFVCKSVPAEEENHEIYTYGIELILSSAINLTLVLTTALVFGKFFETLCFLGTYILIRRYAGGVHAKTHLGCILSFFAVYLLNITTLSFVNANSNSLIYIIVTVSWISVMIIGTIKHPNRPLSKKEHILFSRKARVTATIVAVTIFSLNYLLPPQGQIFVSFATFGMLMAAIVLMIGWLLEHRIGRRDKNEETIR